MNEPADPPNAGQPTASTPGAPTAQPFIHRVCIQCNNMFRVSADKFDAKQCPNCHKG